MTRPIAAALIAISFSAFASAQEVNEHLQVFVTGAMSGRAFTAPFLASDSVSDLDVARNIQPGIEVVFKPQSRVSFGASFQKQVFAQKLTETTPFDWFYYIGQDGDRHLVSLPGTVLFSYETFKSARMYIPAGTAYLNFNRGGSVQPFIGAGAGAALAKTEWKHTVSTSEIFRQYRPDFKVEPSVSLLRSQVGVLRIVGGANFHPMRHVIVRTVAGYLNGGYGTVGVGFGF